MQSATPKQAPRPVIVGTAGHIDHGKTALVKALTGIDADRLAEEKRRGITIDLGFAHLELAGPGGELLRLGFVDVPGHERFVRNMLAGAGGVDLLLFVVASDEGIKPQTREHFAICRLLDVRRGITVLTKADLVDRETLDVLRLELGDFLRGSFLDPASAPMVAVSSRTGQGIEELKREMGRLAAEMQVKDSSALFRLPIDRVFTMKGFGTVVTGTLISGSIAKDAEVEIFPAKARARVRGVQVHGKAAERAVAGERTALNLALERSSAELTRGMMLAAPGNLAATDEMDVSLFLLADAKALRNRARVHLHLYSAETIAEVVLVEKELKAGGESFARLRLADPILVLPGDRFIIRQFSPVVTIGGGVVLDAAPLGKRHKDDDRALAVLAGHDHGKILLERIMRRGAAGLSIRQLVSETGWKQEVLERLARERESAGAIVRAGDLLLDTAQLEAIKLLLMQTVAEFHQRSRLATGIGREELRERLRFPAPAFTAALDSLVAARKLDLAGEQVHLPGRGVVMKDEEAAAKQVIEDAFRAAGLKAPSLNDVLAGLKVDKASAQKLVTLLLREKQLIKVNEELVFHRQALEELRAIMKAQKSKSEKIDIGQFKDLIGVTRKYAIPLLEYLDRERVTRRAGDARVIL